MKRLISLFSIILVLSLSWNTHASVHIKSSEVEVGKNLLNGKSIQATEYKLPGLIQKSYLDTITNTITIVQQRMNSGRDWLKSRGDIMVFGLQQNKLLWDKGINYENSKVVQYNDHIYYELNNMVNAYEIRTGEKIWDQKINFKFIDPGMNIGIGYTYRSTIGVTNVLKGVDLFSGEVLWKRNITQDYDWSNQILNMNDSVILIIAGGLHSINLKNGKGWDYAMITGENQTVVENNEIYEMFEVHAFTGRTGVFLKNEAISGLTSNLIVDNGFVYFASKELLTKIDFDGNVVWTFPIPAGQSGSSELFLKNGKLYLANKGFATFEENIIGPMDPNNYGNAYRQEREAKGERIAYGKPYFSAFNTDNGDLLFLTEVEQKDDQFIQDVKVLDNELILLYPDRIKALSLTDGSALMDKEYLINVLDPFNRFIHKAVYIKDKSGNNSYKIVENGHYLIETKDGNLIVLDKGFKMTHSLVIDTDYLLQTTSYGNHKVFSNDDETVIMDDNGRKVADLSISQNQIIYNGMMYVMTADGFKTIDLKQVTR